MTVTVAIRVTGPDVPAPVEIILSLPQAGSLFQEGPEAVCSMVAACMTHAAERQSKDDAAAVEALLREIPSRGPDGNLN